MKFTQKFVMVSTITLLALVGSMSVQKSVADPAVSGPLRVSLTMTSRDTLAPGEPITLHYVISNTSTSDVAVVPTGAHDENWYRLRLTNASGQQTQAVPDPQPHFHKRAGLYQTEDRTINPEGQLEGDIVVSRLLKPVQPGSFLLSVYVPLSYVTRSNVAFIKAGQPVPTTAFDLVQDFSFPINVTPANPSAVMSDAEALREKLMDLGHASQWATLTETLFALPEAEALSSWESLVVDPGTSDRVLMDAAEQLAYLGTPTAADLLGRLLFERPSSSHSNAELVRASVREALTGMYNGGGHQVQDKLVQVFASHGYSEAHLREIVTTSHPN